MLLEAVLEETSHRPALCPAHHRCFPTGLLSTATEEEIEAQRVQVRCGLKTSFDFQSPWPSATQVSSTHVFLSPRLEDSMVKEVVTHLCLWVRSTLLCRITNCLLFAESFEVNKCMHVLYLIWGEYASLSMVK